MNDDYPQSRLEQDVFRRISLFEEGSGTVGPDWLGAGAGLALGIGLTVVAFVATPVMWMLAFSLDDEASILPKLAFAGTAAVLGASAVYWKRQRLAAQCQRAQQLLESADGDQRQRAMTELILNARRGRAEHARIAHALTSYLRRPPHDQPGEAGRRQVAFSILADQSLSVAAKQKLDLSGAVLAGIRGGSAELPGAILRGADLTGANLARANLERADLQDARIDGANFNGARLVGTVLEGKLPVDPRDGRGRSTS